MVDVYLGLGSNVNPVVNIKSCLDGLQKVFGDIVLSPIYESEAVGIDSPNFYNLVVKIETDFSLAKLSQLFMQIESDFGRETGIDRYKKVTIDIDILLYANAVGLVDGVELPRAEILTNAFVLLPLSIIAETLKHPVTGKTYWSHWSEYDKKSQKLWPVILG